MSNYSDYESDFEDCDEEEMERRWMMSDITEYAKNKELYDKMLLKANKNECILSNRTINNGYIIERCVKPDMQVCRDGDICVSYWAYEGDGHNRKYLDKKLVYTSIMSLYVESKIYVDLYSESGDVLEQSKYKMMYDFIKYYDENHKMKPSEEKLNYA